MPTNRAGYMRAYYESHKERIQAQQRAYRKRRQAGEVSNPWLLDLRVDYKTPTTEDFKAISTKELTYSQKYYAENKEKIKAKQRETRERNKKLSKQRAYYAANRERILEQQRKYQQKKTQEKRMSKTFFGRVILKVKKIFW